MAYMNIHNRFIDIIPTKLKEYIYNHLPKTDRHGFEYTVSELVGMYENSKKMASNWHGQILNDDILKYKTSDTIFLLGSGPSINDITAEQWNQIRKHNSIGFNYWFIHEFIPTFYMFQDAHNNMLDILNDKYKDIPFLIRGSAFAQGKFNLKDHRFNSLKGNPVYFINEYPISSRCSIEIKLLIKYIDALGLIPFGRIADFVPKWRNTLGLLLSLSYQMGYKKIVLCGMDMKDSHHFWDYNSYLNIKKQYSLPDFGTTNIDTFNDVQLSPNTVLEYVSNLREWMHKKNGVEITIINDNTLLFPHLNLYE